MTTPVTFLRQSADELKKIKWSSRSEVIRLTIIVLVISFAVGLYIGALDLFFTTLVETILK